MVEIYTSDRSEVGRKVSWNHVDKENSSSICELDVTALKEVYSEIVDFANKLAESNRVMEDYKDDEDILSAIGENEEIIRRKKEIIELIEARFRELDREDLIHKTGGETEKDRCSRSGEEQMEYL
ncbi:hypothetical protein OIY81_3631 [Cryptosporidium canis]|uniref:Uncharacterized protein n=1 Tax=Cryptosporidium canis TaxID=195482 RepID=A0ABQ8PBP1_9CRYT|nr:hypothetical protein OIY81_3631 [Cryptosporidium canis]KAJ1614829.1 hypothetical protein OJ252_497 [Cryptosporidium canis]